MRNILLDTHAWIWYMNGNKEFTKPILKQIAEASHNDCLYLAAISVWEISMLENKKRITLGMPCLEWIKKSLAINHAQIAPLTPEIAVESCNLAGTFHEDPADRMIVATARIERLTILTRDARILAYSKQKYVSAIEI